MIDSAGATRAPPSKVHSAFQRNDVEVEVVMPTQFVLFRLFGRCRDGRLLLAARPMTTIARRLGVHYAQKYRKLLHSSKYTFRGIDDKRVRGKPWPVSSLCRLYRRHSYRFLYHILLIISRETVSPCSVRKLARRWRLAGNVSDSSALLSFRVYDGDVPPHPSVFTYPQDYSLSISLPELWAPAKQPPRPSKLY